MRKSLLVLALVGCSNELKDPGQCSIPAASGEPIVANVPLFGQPA